MKCTRCNKEGQGFMRLMKIIFIVPPGPAYNDDLSKPEPYIIEIPQEVRVCSSCLKAGATEELIDTVKQRSSVPRTHTRGMVEWGK